MKIIELYSENIKKIKAVRIIPKGNTVVISGDNEQGKTSVLDSIWYALEGGTALKGVKQPIRKGESKAKVELDLGDLKVTRTWTDKGSYLKVVPLQPGQSPQAVLDKLIGDLSFDPLEFTRMSDKEQREALIKLSDIDLDLNKWERDRKAIYDERTEINRKVKEYETRVAHYPAVPDDTPDEEIDIQVVTDEYTAASIDIARYQKEQDRIEALRIRRAQLQKELEAVADEAREIVHSMKRELPDINEIKARLDTVGQTNANVRAYLAHQDDITKLDGYQGTSEALTSDIDNLDSQKSKALKAAKFPIPDLSFDELGITYKGIPFKQCSASESLRVSLAMAMALNPELKVIRIMDGSLLGPKNKAMIKEMISEKDYQVWIEVVDTTGKVGVYIEDGEVKNS